MASMPEAIIELEPRAMGATIEVDFEDYVTMAFDLADRRAECTTLRAEVERLRAAAQSNRRRAFHGIKRLGRWLAERT